MEATEELAPAADGGPPLQLAWGLGLRPAVQNCVLALDDTTVLYPQGRTLARLNVETNAMTFLSGGERGGLPVAVALAPSRKMVAVCEQRKGDGHPVIGLYDLAKTRRLRTLTYAANGSRFVSAAFSGDGKQLAAVSEAPDFHIVLWAVDKGRVEAMAKQPGLHTRVSFCPRDPQRTTALVCSGPRSLKLWTLVEDSRLKDTPIYVGKRSSEQPEYTDHCWWPVSGKASAAAKAAAKTSSSAAAATPIQPATKADVQFSDAPMLCAVTASGTVLLFLDGQPDAHYELKQSLTLFAAHGDQTRPAPSAIRCLACTRGFLVSAEKGLLALFERNATDGLFYQTRSFTCALPKAGVHSSTVRNIHI